ncbi:MAG: thiamine-phosphate kinase [Chloroflexi bacterium]|nr:thiamine-phosphate kinase [Chloroflexota bacterium]
MDVRELGEFGLIARLASGLGAASDSRLVMGIGDDAAVWRTGAGAYAIATTDTMVAGVHFLPAKVAWRDVGWKALAVNVSDISAMGGTPTFALVTLCLPPETAVEDVDALYAGLRECAEAYGVTIAGGDIVSAPVLSVTVALMGEATVSEAGEPLLLRRDAARMGDAIAVTGPLGGSAGGLRALVEGTSAQHADLVAAHMRPRARVETGNVAVRSGVRCGMDISDGLVQDLGRVCEASGVGAEIRMDDVPLFAGLGEAFGDDAARKLALTGGEDYELLLIAPDDVLRASGLPLHYIGRITGDGEQRVRVLNAAGNEIAIGTPGWDHLRPHAEPRS